MLFFAWAALVGWLTLIVKGLYSSTESNWYAKFVLYAVGVVSAYVAFYFTVALLIRPWPVTLRLW